MLAFGPQQFFNGRYVPDEREFHERVLKALKVHPGDRPRMRKYFHSMDIRMGKLRPGASLSSRNRAKRVDIQLEKFEEHSRKREEVMAARQMGKSRALAAMYGSRQMAQSVTWWSGGADLERAGEDYRTAMLNK